MKHGVIPQSSLAALSLLWLAGACRDAPTTPRAPATLVAAAVSGDREAGPSCPAFTVRDLGPGRAEDINDDGDVVGTNGRAVMWTARGALVDLGPGVANGINKHGVVVGTSSPIPGIGGLPFVWTQANGVRDLPLDEFFESGQAYAINDHGLIVGSEVSDAFERGQGLYWPTPDEIGHLASGVDLTAGFDVNKRGVVAGFTAAISFQTAAVYWPTPSSVFVDIGGLPTSGLTQALAYGLNDRNEIVGWSLTQTSEFEDETHAFLWTPEAGMRDLGTLGGTFSQAADINARGQVVGVSKLAGDGATHAFLWTDALGMIDLGTLDGATDSRATAINRKGEVVGESGGHAVVWTLAKGCALR